MDPRVVEWEPGRRQTTLEVRAPAAATPPQDRDQDGRQTPSIFAARDARESAIIAADCIGPSTGFRANRPPGPTASRRCRARFGPWSAHRRAIAPAARRSADPRPFARNRSSVSKLQSSRRTREKMAVAASAENPLKPQVKSEHGRRGLSARARRSPCRGTHATTAGAARFGATARAGCRAPRRSRRSAATARRRRSRAASTGRRP